MNEPDTTEVIALRLQRKLPATPDQVFDAYTDPEWAKAWLSALGPDEGEVQATVDLRVGGVWDATFRPNPATRVHDVQTYVEIERPRRLVADLVSDAEMAEQKMPPVRTRIALTLEPEGAGTLVTVEQSGFASEEQRDFFANVAWPAGLDRIAVHIAGG